jgi:hypothetical protein
MADWEWWSWALTVIGLAGFFLAGKKIWWAWYVNIANQGVWLAYALVTEQWGFLVGVVAYTIVFTKNAISWTKEHKGKSMSDDDNTQYMNGERKS